MALFEKKTISNKPPPEFFPESDLAPLVTPLHQKSAEYTPKNRGGHQKCTKNGIFWQKMVVSNKPPHGNFYRIGFSTITYPSPSKIRAIHAKIPQGTPKIRKKWHFLAKN